MESVAVILEKPGELSLRAVSMRQPTALDVFVDVDWSGISAGTERLLWTGRMPEFPGMGYPLVPGYETAGRVAAGSPSDVLPAGTPVFIPGSASFEGVRCLFGGSARRLVVPAAKVVKVPEHLGVDATLLALAATAHHAVPLDRPMPELIVGHGALGRLIARIAVLAGGPPPVVWERHAGRRSGAEGYAVIAPEDDDRRNYARICDVSGDVAILDDLIARLAPGGEITLAGFYDKPIRFDFPPAFMREARLRIAAQWHAADLTAVASLIAGHRLSLSGIVTHTAPASAANTAYRQAFEDADCLKMCLDWRSVS